MLCCTRVQPVRYSTASHCLALRLQCYNPPPAGAAHALVTTLVAQSHRDPTRYPLCVRSFGERPTLPMGSSSRCAVGDWHNLPSEAGAGGVSRCVVGQWHNLPSEAGAGGVQAWRRRYVGTVPLQHHSSSSSVGGRLLLVSSVVCWDIGFGFGAGILPRTRPRRPFALPLDGFMLGI